MVSGLEQAVKFTPPKREWKLKEVIIIGMLRGKWARGENNFGVEIRDAKLNLLYQYKGAASSYFVSNEPKEVFLEIPDIVMNGSFFICFDSEAVVSIFTETNYATGNSYYYDKQSGKLLQGEIPLKNNSTLPVNWVIRARGV